MKTDNRFSLSHPEAELLADLLAVACDVWSEKDGAPSKLGPIGKGGLREATRASQRIRERIVRKFGLEI